MRSRRPSEPVDAAADLAGGDEIDLAAIRAKIARGSGPAFWKSLDAVADTEPFRRFVAREYPAAAPFMEGPDRRRFFKLMAASFAMAGLAACDAGDDGRAVEIPYVRQPERIEAGQPLSYASSTLIDGFANGILVTTIDGRPIKIEGNPQHPWSRGGTDIFGQASVLGLYDPARSQAVRYLDRISSWDAFRNPMIGQAAALRADKGRGLRILTGPVTSPSLIAQLQDLLRALPDAKWHMMSAQGGAPLEASSQATFGARLDTRLRFDRARAVVAFDGDFLDPGPGQVGLSRRYMDARQASAAAGPLLVLHAAASTPNLTSAKADHHLAADPDEIASLVSRLTQAIASPPPVSGSRADVWLARAARALAENKGASIVTAGATQSPAIVQAIHRLNAALGNIGNTVMLAEPVLPQAEDLSSLVSDMNAGSVEILFMLGCNPVYEAPGTMAFGAALRKVRLSVHAGEYVDETAIRSMWHLPLAHPLESWGDARALDGTAGLIQPTILPLYEGRTVSEILSLVFDEQARNGLTIVRDHWRGRVQSADFETKWREALLAGFWPDTAAAERTATPVAAPPGAAGVPLDIRPDRINVLFRPDPTIRDSVHAANGWLQELPKSLTKIVWDNAVAISPKLAERLKIATGDIVAVSSGELRVEGAAWIMPGQAERSVTLTLGYGRSAPDMIFDGLGYDANLLRSASAPWLLADAVLTKTGRRGVLATTQDHNTMEGHDFIRIQREGDDVPQEHAPKRSLYGPTEGAVSDGADEPRAWGMVIDLDSCIGCDACAIACQSENNIAIVGKEQVALGRHMHWLRIDRYYSSEKQAGQGVDDPDIHFQPVPCMHCELAPCEVGCPVEATLHDQEGLNLMVYNRCVGTRACSGYCPYKVRRFNYLDYTAGQSPSIQTRNNPDVTVRSRGVMEKCTYCVQRIVEARISSSKSNQPIADGAVVTACQGACPTRAITFGNLADTNAAVTAKRADPRNYDLLGELNVRPRTTYLAERAPARPAHPREG